MGGARPWFDRLFGLAVIAGLAVGCGDDGQSSQTTNPFVPTTVTTGPATDSEPGTTPGDPSMGTDDPDSTGDPPTTGSTQTADGTATGDSGYDGEPGEFTLTFDGRDYRMYVPSGYDHAAAIPLLVGFHGAGDSGGNFYQFVALAGMTDAAEPAEYILVVPDTKSPFSDFVNWSGNPNADVDEMLLEMDGILALVDDVAIHYHVDDQQQHAFGFSNGGLFTALAGMARADRLATLTVLGYGWGSSYLPPSPPSRAIPVQFGCGANDSFYGNAQAAESFLAGQGHDTRLVTAAGVGHSVSGVLGAMTPPDMFAWMQARPRP